MIFVIVDLSPTQGQESEPLQIQTLRKVMQGADVPTEEADSFVAALKGMSESGDCSALKPYLKSRHEPLAIISGFAFAMYEPKQLRKRLHRALERENSAPSRAQMVSGSLVASRKTVDLLLARWTEERSEDLNAALWVATGEFHDSLADWQDWWKTERETFKPRPVRSLDDAFARVQRSGIANIISLVKKEFKAEEVNYINDVFGALGDLQKIGEEKEHRFAAKGDRFFRTGKIDLAYECYQAALKENDADSKSRYLLGCIDFERGDYELAKKRFEVVGQLDRCYTAKFLEKLSVRCLESKNEELSKAVLEVLSSFSEDDLKNLRELEDLVMKRIVGQAMVQKGIYYLDKEAVHEVMAAHSDNLNIQIGGSLLLPYASRGLMLEAIAENNPNSPLAQYLAISYSINDFEKKESVERFVRRWIKLEPDNFLPQYLFHHMRHLVVEERDYDNPPTFPEEVWTELTKAAKRKRSDSHFEKSVEAQREVLNLVGFYFPETAMQSTIPSFMLPLMAAQRKRAEMRPESADEMHQIIERLTEIRGGVIWHMVRLAMLASSEDLLKERPAEERRDGTQDVRNSVMTVSSIQQLPIPRLQRELFKVLSLDSPEYLDDVRKVLAR